MRLIDADAVMRSIKPWTPEMDRCAVTIANARKLIITAIDSCKTVDAVPVVRCKDCMYWESGENESEKWEWCTMHGINIGPHSFCSYGDRMDGDK